jgi:hypothetical protein
LGRVKPGQDGVLDLRVGVGGSEVGGLVLDCRVASCECTHSRDAPRNDGGRAEDIVVFLVFGDSRLHGNDEVGRLEKIRWDA